MKDSKGLSMIMAVKKYANKKISDNFNSKEFDCSCSSEGCAFTLYSLEMLRLLEQLRILNGQRPLVINCGFRCTPHNSEPAVGGARFSQHLVGLAVDIRRPTYLSFDQFKAMVYKLPFKFILSYPDKDFIHVDLRTGDF